MNRSGEQCIAVLRISDGGLQQLTSSGTAATSLDVAGLSAAAVLNSPNRPAALALLDLDHGNWTVVKSSIAMIMDEASI